ncbi:hypothetical protein [Thioclava kandeliae]|uniref:Uncharacterized protein n=1 Tax=Thioclava kandeliae TaxID=3070818 RepID=A0ABV1SGC2_9RHOB
MGEFLQTGGGEMSDFFDNIAPKVGVTAEQFRGLSGPDALQLYVDTLYKAGLNQQEMTFYMESMADEASALAPLLKDGGAAMQEYANRAKEVGAVMDGQTLAALGRGKQALNDMQLALSGMRNTIGAQMIPALQAMAAAITAAATFFRENADTIMTVLRTLTGTAVVAAAIFAGRFAIAIGVTAAQAIMSASAAAAAHQIMMGRMTLSSILAANAVRGLAVACDVLKGAIMATGIGLLIVGAGYLVGEFVQLVSATGSFGGALSMIGDLGREVFDRIVLALQAANSKMTALAIGFRASMLDTFAEIVTAGVEFANRYIGIYRGAYQAVVTVWSLLPAAIGDFAYEAANSLITAVEAMINGVVSRINMFIEGLNYVPGINIAPVADVDLAGIENPYKGAMQSAGAAAADAFAQGFNENTLSNGGAATALQGMADNARDMAGNASLAADSLAALATTPLQSWKALQDTIRAAKEEAGQTPTMPVADPLAGSGGGGSDTPAARQAKKTKEEVTALQRATDDWKSSWQDGFKGMVTGAQSLSDALSGVLSKLADMLLESAFNGLWKSMGLGDFAGGVLGGFGIGANANGTPSWRGGLTHINERGGEIMDLPKGTRIIPHDVSMQMAKSAASGGGSNIGVTVAFDESGNLYVKSVAQQTVAQGLSQYDGNLANRVQQINANPRKRG